MSETFQTEVTLPSKGKFYGNKWSPTPLPGGKITLRPITVKEEKVIVSSRTTTGKLERVLDLCMITKFPLNELLLTDKYFLILSLRSISYGAEYFFKLTCPSCQTKFTHKVVLPQGLTLKEACEEDHEPFEVLLPVCGKKVTLRFLRVSDEEEVDRYVAQMVTVEEGDPSYSYRISRQILTVDGVEPDALEKLSFFESLIGSDSLAIRRALQERETGLDLTLHAQCKGCRYEFDTLVPFSNEFFPARV